MGSSKRSHSRHRPNEDSDISQDHGRGQVDSTQIPPQHADGGEERENGRDDDQDSALGESVREEVNRESVEHANDGTHERASRSGRTRIRNHSRSRSTRSSKRKAADEQSAAVDDATVDGGNRDDDSAYTTARSDVPRERRQRSSRRRSRLVAPSEPHPSHGGNSREIEQRGDDHEMGDMQQHSVARDADSASQGPPADAVVEIDPLEAEDERAAEERANNNASWSYYSYFTLQEPEVRRVMANGFKKGQILPVKASDLPPEVTGGATPRVLVIQRPVFTVACVVAQVVLFVVAMAADGNESMRTNPWFGPSWDRLMDLGAKWFPDVRSGQVWRLLSAAFIPPGLILLLLSIAFHVAVCAPVERLHGWRRMGAIYLCAAVFASLCSCVFVPANVFVGPSGAMYGIAGVLYCDVVENWPYLASPERDVFVLFAMTVGSLGLGLLPGVDNWAHIGGLFAGVLAGVLLLPNMGMRMSRRRLLIATSAPILVCLYIAAIVTVYAAVSYTSPCAWCRSTTCLPINDWCEI
eukprot:Opistho-2@83240